MPGWELINNKEKKELIKIFTKSNGVFMAHGFDERRNFIYRVKLLEKKISKILKVKYCTLTTSGKMAQFIAMKAIGIKKNDEVITQSFTFVATIEAILALGAKPIIVDIDETLNMDPNELKKKISYKTKLVIPVPMLGNPNSLNEILKITKKYKVPIIEDACEALGAKYKKKYVGTYGEMGIFSLDFAKTITTGEGGIIVTNKKKYDNYCKEYRDHGHKNIKNLQRGLDKRKIYGLNLRMSELQAAVGLAQIDKLNFILKKNAKNKSLYKNLINKKDFFNYRKITDTSELADTLIFIFKNAKIANQFVDNLKKEKIFTKNIPDALDWHFSKRWHHMKKEIKLKKNSWLKSENILNRSVALAISTVENKAIIKKKAKIINKILDTIS